MDKTIENFLFYPSKVSRSSMTSFPNDHKRFFGIEQLTKYEKSPFNVLFPNGSEKWLKETVKLCVLLMQTLLFVLFLSISLSRSLPLFILIIISFFFFFIFFLSLLTLFDLVFGLCRATVYDNILMMIINVWVNCFNKQKFSSLRAKKLLINEFIYN